MPLTNLQFPVAEGYVPDFADLPKHLTAIRTALTIRAVEQRLLELFGQGKLFGTVHTCIGQEFTGVAVAQSLQIQDYVFSNHRCHGHFLSYCGNVEGLVAEIMGKATGVCAGRGGSQHLHQGRFFSNGIQGGFAPVAAGLAWAQQLQQNGGITVAFLGDGTLGEGALYETLNIASKWALPILFVVENNRYAQSTAIQETLAGDIPLRFEAFGIKGMQGSTWAWHELIEDLATNIASIRTHGGPRFHIVDTYRLRAHSKGDDNRLPSEVHDFELRDPLNLLLQRYGDLPDWQDMLAHIQSQVDTAVVAAEAAPFADPSTLGSKNIIQDLEWSEPHFYKERFTHAIQAALDTLLSNHPLSVMLGEDILHPYGGAFKVSGNLSERHPGRVRNTPISEAAILGIANGMALAGHRSIAEIMFGDFCTLVADQWINHAAKFEWMYNQQVCCPVVLRTPMGGRRGYGPTHSQSLERHFVGVPGTQVLCLHHRCDPRGLYEALWAQGMTPTMVIENKRLYANMTDEEAPTGFTMLRDNKPFPTTWLRAAAKPNLTIVAIGATSIDVETAALELFDQEEIVADLIFPTLLYPMKVDFLSQSLQETRQLLIVEEGQGFAGMAAEIIAQVQERWPHWKVRCERVAADECPIPTSRPLEELVLPSKERIKQAMISFSNE